jgi:hypothetical protein
MAEYKIAMIDEDEPRKWDGPHGTVWYITVGLEGHPKPVSIGKKSPDALKVGDIVYGTIQPTDYLTDKWKADPKPQTGSTPQGTQRASEAFLKDMSNTPILMYNGSLHYAKELGLNLITDANDLRVYLEYVQNITNEMLAMVDNVRNGGSQEGSPPASQVTQVPRGEATTSLKDNWAQIQSDKAVSYDDPPENENG